MEPEENSGTEESVRSADHASSLLHAAEPSQSLSPPPGPSGLAIFSPPQPHPLVSIGNHTEAPPTSTSHTNTVTDTVFTNNHRPPTVIGIGHSVSRPPTESVTLPTITHPPSTTSVSGYNATPSSVGGDTVANGNQRSVANLSIFQIPQSQDILAGSHNFSLGLNSSQSLGGSSLSLPPGPPPDSLNYDFTTPDADLPRFIRNDDVRRREEEAAKREEKQAVQTQEESEPSTLSDTPQVNEPEAAISNNEGALAATITNELTERADRHFRRLRDKLMGVPIVPGTESSRSSDEGQATSLRAAVHRMEQKSISGVPESGLSVHVKAPSPPGNQVLPATATESDGSSGEACVPKPPRRTTPVEPVLSQHIPVEVTVAPHRSPDSQSRSEDGATPSSSSEDTEKTPPKSSLKLGAPSWGAGTDSSTEYPTQTASSWSDKTTSSSSGTSSVGPSADSQTVSQFTQPLISSTPYEEMAAHLPRLPRLHKMTRSKKRESEETTSSTTTTTSSSTSAGELGKFREQITLSQLTQEQSLEVPLAPQTQSQEMSTSVGALDRLHVPSSVQDEDETQPLEDEPRSRLSVQSLVQESQEDLANEKPAWYADLGNSQQMASTISAAAVEEQTDESADSAVSPPRKRKRDRSSSSDELPKWQKLEQGQPSVQRPSNSPPQINTSPSNQPDTNTSLKNRDSSFTSSQAQSSSGSSSTSSAPKSSSPSTLPSSSDSSYPGSGSGTTSTSHSGGSNQQSSTVPSSSSSGYAADDSQTPSQEQRELSSPQSPSQGMSKSSQSGSGCGVTKGGVGEVESSTREHNSPVNDGRLSARDVDGDKSASLLGDDDDNTLTLEVQSPKVIDLTQSQSQSVVECDSFQKSNKPVATLLKPKESPDILRTSADILRTSTDDVGKNLAKADADVAIISPLTLEEDRGGSLEAEDRGGSLEAEDRGGSLEAEDRGGSLEAEEPMDVDSATQNSFCLQLSPSQSHPTQDSGSKNCSVPNSTSLKDEVAKGLSVDESKIDSIDHGSSVESTSVTLSDASPLVEGAVKSQEPLYESLTMEAMSESLLSSGKSEAEKTVSPQPEQRTQKEPTPLPTPTPTDPPFQLKLPTDSLIEPLSTITPPSQSIPSRQQSSTPSLSPLVSNTLSTTQSEPHKSTAVSVAMATSPQALSDCDSNTSSHRNTRGSETDTSFTLHLDTNTSESSLVSMATAHTQTKATGCTITSDSLSDQAPPTSTSRDMSTQPSLASEHCKVPSTPKTPRKSLSLRGRRTPKRVVLDKQRESNALGFVIGVQSQETEQSLVIDSQIPPINVPRDSQFDSSDSSDLPFCISLPKEQESSSAPNTQRLPSPKITPKSLFSGFQSGATSRMIGRQSLEGRMSQTFEDVFNTRKDPYEYNSQSQECEVQFVRPRRQRNKPSVLTDSLDNGSNGQTAVSSVRREGEEAGHEQTCTLSSLDQSVVTESTGKERSKSPRVLTDSIDTGNSSELVDGCVSRESEDTGRRQSSSSFTPDRSVVVESQTVQAAAPLQDRASSSQNQSNSVSSQGSLSQVSNSQTHLSIPTASQSLTTPTNSQVLATPPVSLGTTHPSLQSPLPSAPLEFTSPRTMISPQGLEDFKRQARQEGVNRYELRHVRTVRTVIEQRIVSSEVIENDRVVTSHVWPEHCEPRVIQEVKVELTPQMSTSSYTFPGSPPILPTTVIHNMGPSMNIINSPAALIEAPLPSSFRQLEDERGSRDVTPSTGHRGNRPPVRRVHPTPRRPMGEETTPTTRASAPVFTVSTDHHGDSDERADGSDSAGPETVVPSRPSHPPQSSGPSHPPQSSGPSQPPQSSGPSQPPQSSGPSHPPQRSGPSQPPQSSRPSEQRTSSTPSEVTADQPLLGVGSKVIAKWRDKCWYMATVTAEGKQGRMRVKYADGDLGTVAASNLIHIDSLKVGVAVSAVPLFLEPSQSSSDLQPSAKINGLFEGFSDESHQTFHLRCGDEVKEFSCACLCVQSESIKMCTEEDKPSPKTAVVSRKRKRRSDPGTASKRRRLSTPPAGVNKAPEQLFKGYVFALTQRPKDESESASPKVAGVNKEHMSRQIRSRGGRVVETFKTIPVVDGRTFVLSDNFCKTIKFLVGLAMDVPCVAYSWISDSIEQGEVLEYSHYRLPVGVSDDGTVIHWRSKHRLNLLKGRTIHLIGKDSFKKHWITVMEACGARLVQKLPTLAARSHSSNLETIAVVCEHLDLVSPSLLHQARNNPSGLCIATPNWLVQCIVLGQQLSPDQFSIT